MEPLLTTKRPKLHCLLALLLGYGSFASFTRAADAPSTAPAPSLQIDAAFPGGNILVGKVDGDTAHLRQDLRDTAGDWFYWYFRARGAAGRTIRFQFTGSDVIGARGPCVSTDGGRTWAWLGRDTVRDRGFSYTFPANADDVRFSMTVPYVESNLRDWLARHKDNPALKVDTLCKTKKNRDAELLRLGRLDGKAPNRVVLTARHHACETMASWELEGIMESVLADDDAGRWFRENVELLVVPFVDKDGVEDGDQGKNRRPHDHNRDYMGDAPIHATVAALKKLVPEWAGAKGVRVALDLHCPALRGDIHEVTHFVLGPDERIAENVVKLSKLLETTSRDGPLPFKGHKLKHGTSWNTLKEPRPFSRWAATLPGVEVAATLELPYATAAGRDVTADSARAFGRSFGKAIGEYLKVGG